MTSGELIEYLMQFDRDTAVVAVLDQMYSTELRLTVTETICRQYSSQPVLVIGEGWED